MPRTTLPDAYLTECLPPCPTAAPTTPVWTAGLKEILKLVIEELISNPAAL